MGQAIAAAGVDRARLFLISKLHPKDLGYVETLAAFNQSLIELNTSYLDLFMLHYPSCVKGVVNCTLRPEQTWQNSWRALEALVAKKLVKSIGKQDTCMCWQSGTLAGL